MCVCVSGRKKHKYSENELKQNVSSRWGWISLNTKQNAIFRIQNNWTGEGGLYMNEYVFFSLSLSMFFIYLFIFYISARFWCSDRHYDATYKMIQKRNYKANASFLDRTYNIVCNRKCLYWKGWNEKVWTIQFSNIQSFNWCRKLFGWCWCWNWCFIVRYIV